jgi:hypothetical protein
MDKRSVADFERQEVHHGRVNKHRDVIHGCDYERRDDELKWGQIAMKLNRTTLACRKRMRMILDCGIYGEEKMGEHN